MIDAKAEVLRRYPGAECTWLESRELNRKGWVIRPNGHHRDVSGLLGGGPTEEAAWAGATSRIPASEPATITAKAEVLAEYPEANVTSATTRDGLRVWLVYGKFAPPGIGWCMYGGTQEDCWSRVAETISWYRTLPKKDGPGK